MFDLPHGTRARTGETCPESGAWSVTSIDSSATSFVKGERMTSYNGQNVVWKLFFYI